MTRLIKGNVERIAEDDERVKKLIELGFKVLEEQPKEKKKGDKQ